MRNLVCVALAMLLSACAQNAPIKLYDGAERGPAQVLTVRVPADLEVETVNGSKAPGLGGLGRGDFQVLHLQPGDYQIAAFYKGVFDVMGVNTEVVRSRVVYFDISGQAGDVWTLDFKRPPNLEEARSLRRQFNAWAVNSATGQRREARQGGQPNTLMTQLVGSGSQGASSQPYIEPLRAQAASIEPQWQPSAQMTSTTPPAYQPSNAGSVSASGSAGSSATGAPGATLPHSDATLTTLKQLWELLTPESRKAFLQWAQ